MARSFNGTSDLISLAGVSFSNPLGLRLTISAWIKTTATSGTIYGSDSGSSPSRMIQFRVLSNKLSMVLFLNSGTARTWTSTTSVNTGSWVHVGGTYNGTSGSVWVNGGAEGTATLSANTGRTQAARIGAQLAGVSQIFFNGTIGEVALTAQTLTSSQMLGLASGLPPSHFGFDHYWPLWGVDSPEPDIGNSTHQTGVLTGTTAVPGARVGRMLTEIPG